MSGMFGALDRASSGAHVSNVWMDAIADNVANVNTVRPAGQEPFRARQVLATPDET
jgi:flagellar basal-body rod protein FlgC